MIRVVNSVRQVLEDFLSEVLHEFRLIRFHANQSERMRVGTRIRMECMEYHRAPFSVIWNEAESVLAEIGLKLEPPNPVTAPIKSAQPYARGDSHE